MMGTEIRTLCSAVNQIIYIVDTPGRANEHSSWLPEPESLLIPHSNCINTEYCTRQVLHLLQLHHKVLHRRCDDSRRKISES